jgi:hypothetical protein
MPELGLSAKQLQPNSSARSTVMVSGCAGGPSAAGSVTDCRPQCRSECAERSGGPARSRLRPDGQPLTGPRLALHHQ